MIIKYRGHKDTKQFSLDKCLLIAKDYNAGMPINKICEKYPNQRTHKPCSRVYVYWALKKAQNIKN